MINRKKGIKHRFISAIISCALLLQLAPISAYAEGSAPINLALGKTYETSIACHSGGMKDDANDLTDGKTGSLGDGSGYTNLEWVGYNPKNDSADPNKLFSIILDLGELKQIGKIRTNYGQSYGNGIVLPEKVTYYVSDDKITWNKVTEITHDLDTTPVTTYSYIYENNVTPVSGRYVKAEIDAIYPTGEGEWILIDEFQVFTPEAQTPVEPPIPELEPGVIGNLARGKAYTLSVPAHPDYPDKNNKELTDGIYGRSDYGDSAWSGHTGGAPLRTISFDLGKVDTITSISANFLSIVAGAVKMPTAFDIQVSKDGTNWSTVPSDVFIPKPQGDGPYKITWKAENNITPNNGLTKSAVAARYVRVIFGWQNWCMIDEVEIIGEVGEQNYAVTLPKDEVKVPAYLQAGEATGGINNLLLIYNGHYDNAVGSWSESDYDPYLVYRDTKNNPIDRFFDGYLFLGLRTPFGHTLAGASSYNEAGDIEDWNWYIDKTFGKDGDLDNLEKATQNAATDLKNSNLKSKVVLTIPYPDPKQIDFGDVDNDGLSECLSPEIKGEAAALAAKKKVVDWYLQKVMKKWNEKSYKNLELAGFYWLEEDVEEPQIVRYANSLIHGLDLTSYWIPWSGATAYSLWERLGFDAVAFQPNHTFHGTSVQRIEESANKALAFGTTVEMELDAAAVKGNPDIYQRYFDYLDGGVDFGYDDPAVYKAYYQDVKALKDAAVSNSPKVRYIYDATYQFIKGTYTKGYLKYLTPENATYADIIDVNAAIASIDKKLALAGNTPEEIKFLNAEKERALNFLTIIESNKAKIDSIMTSFLNAKVEDIKLSDYEALNTVLKDATELLNSKNLTDRQRKDLTKKQSDLQALFNAIAPVKVANDAINALPNASDINKTHEGLVLAAKNAVRKLSAHQVALIAPETMKKYQDVISAYDTKFPVPVEPSEPETPDVSTITSSTGNVSNAVLVGLNNLTFDADVKFAVNLLDLKDVTVKLPKDMKLLEAYDLKLLLNNVEMILKGKVKISLKLSDALKSSKKLALIYIDKNGNISEVASTIENGYISFVTDHFSTYAIVEKSTSKPPIPNTGDKSAPSIFLILIISGFAIVISKQRRRI